MPDTVERTHPGPLVSRHDGQPWELCKHPEDRIEWRRDPLLFRWVGICRRCGIGRTFDRGTEPIVRTDEQIAQGKAPDVSEFSHWVATTMPSLNYEPW